jgi:hypothetical protein
MIRRVVHLFLLVVLGSALNAGVVHAQDPRIAAARTAVDAWLLLVDVGNHAASWETAASVFRNAVTQDKWASAVQAARTPLGPVKSRTLKGTSIPKSPGAPTGEYLVFQFDSIFEQRPLAVETVTAFQENDGTWHVAGYFVK